MSLWKVQEVEFRARELDFSSSGQGRHATTAVMADGTEIINALDLCDAQGDPIQVIVCGAGDRCRTGLSPASTRGRADRNLSACDGRRRTETLV